MAKEKRNATTARGVAALLKAGEKCEARAGDGLYLKVNGENAGTWVFRYQLAGKRRRMGLGSASAGGLTLAEARSLALEQRSLLTQGKDPLAVRDSQEHAAKVNVITFDMVAVDYIEAKRGEWTNAKHAYQWEQTLTAYVFPVIGHLPPAEVTTEHVLEILQPIWHTKAETARAGCVIVLRLS